MGCPESTTAPDAATPPSPDAFSAGDAPSTTDAFSAEDAPVVLADAYSADDAPQPTDAADVCARCICTGFGPEDAGDDAGMPDCFTVPGSEVCCAAIGPLMPPDLAV